MVPACSRHDAGTAASRPNILLISIDTLRADALSIYSGTESATPAFAALAHDSVVFENAIAAANHTAPSHATMLTGASPAVHGVVNTIQSSPRAIPDSLPTLAERLKSAGWATAANTAAGYVTHPFGFHRGFDEFTELYEFTEKKVDPAVEWFKRLPKGTPGFYFLHTYEAHAPYLPHPADARPLGTKYQDSVIPDRLGTIFALPQELQLPRGHGVLFAMENDLTDRDIECLRELYRMAVTRIDAALGRLFKNLDDAGILDSTLVIVTSDHGEEFREHDQLQHDQIYDEVLHVPLIVRFPGADRRAARVALTFPSVDLAPSILDYVGLPPSQFIDGKSRKLQFMGNPAAQAPDRAFAAGFKGEKQQATAVRTPLLKVINHKTAEGRDWQECYQLFHDPGERTQLPAGKVPQAAGLVELLKMQESMWLAMFEHHAPTAKSGELDEKSRELLRGIGYVR
jgi:arylsulfatase A-like enzyme